MELEGYDILKKLGEGGTSKVYLAEKRGLGGFRKPCVLKCLKPALTQDRVVREDFLAEARLSARMSHPNVVQVHEVFEVSGVPILVMEYLDGQPLSVLRRELRSALNLELELLVLIRALEGLHYVHELTDDDGKPLGVVHRDVSPQNLIVTYDGDVKVLDFGIAKVAESAETEYGVIKGKISHLAPEQLRASETDKIDRRADLFAMGILLWEAAAGRPMWAGVSESEVLGRLLEGRLPALEPRTPCAKVLAPIIERALQVDPRNRFAGAEEMRQALLAILDTVEPRPTTADLKALLEQHYGAQRAARNLAEPGLEPYDSAVALFRSQGDTETRRTPTPAAEIAAPPLFRRATWRIVADVVLTVLAMGGAYAFFNRAPPDEDPADAPAPAPAPDSSAPAVDAPEAPSPATAAEAAAEYVSAPCPDAFSISNFEAGKAESCRTEGRSGAAFYLYFDGTGETLPPAGLVGPSNALPTPRGSSRHALHLRGSNLTDWGVGISARFDASEPVDLRGYEGLRIWMRSDTNTKVRVSIATVVTLDETYGGDCHPEIKLPCNDHYATVRLVSPFWQEVRVPLTGLQQLGWGKPAPWRPDAALEIHIGMHNGENGKDGERAETLTFDVWVDDISFY